MSILSIQSSVAYGHVGNGAAVFSLRRLGFEVWPVNTVHFSNHPGHGAWRGRTATHDEVSDVIAGVGERGAFARCRAVLSGYLGAAETGPVVLAAVAAVKAANPQALYCCDPVMGDVEEGLYVAPAVARFFRGQAVPTADIVVPNAFELAVLAGRPVESTEDALAAARAVLAKGPSLVVVTSVVSAAAPDTIGNLAVGGDGAWHVTTPRLPTTAKGAGDAFAALFLGRYLETRDAGAALSAAASSLYAVIEATSSAGAGELLLVAAQDALAAPPSRFVAEHIDTGHEPTGREAPDSIEPPP